METCKRGHPRTEENIQIRTDGYRDCRPCQRIRRDKWAAANPERVRARRERLRAEGRIQRHWREYNWRKWGLDFTEEDYQALYAQQQGRCLHCDRHWPRLVIDHDHETLEIRGLLCVPCNAQDVLARG